MGLVGMKAICVYFGFSESTIIKLHNEEGFPMTKLCGVWHSDGHLIEEWRRGRIMEDAKVRKYLKNQNVNSLQLQKSEGSRAKAPRVKP